MTAPLKLCVNCKWCRIYSVNGIDAHRCAAPGANIISPVTGLPDRHFSTCETGRAYDMPGYCGPNARFYEPKEADPAEAKKDFPTEAEVDEMARLDRLQRRPIGSPHEL